MEQTFTGTLIYISPTELVGAKSTPKITISVRESEGDYPQTLVGQIFGKNTEYFKSKVGEQVEVHYNFSGSESIKEGITRRFGNTNIWKVETVGSSLVSSSDVSKDLPF